MDTLAGRSNSPFFLSVAGLLEKDTVSSSDFVRERSRSEHKRCSEAP